MKLSYFDNFSDCESNIEYRVSCCLSFVIAFLLTSLLLLLLFSPSFFFFSLLRAQVAASGKAILITGCESPLAWCLVRKLDELGFTIFAGFTKRTGCADADLLKEETSGRTKILQLDVTSETQVKHERTNESKQMNKISTERQRTKRKGKKNQVK